MNDRSSPSENPADNPLTLAHVLSNRIGRAFYGEVEARYGVSLAEWRVLLTLAQAPGLSAADVTSRWAMEKMSVNRAIRKLVASGAVRRSRDPADGRVYLLTLTPAGRRLYDKIRPAANARFRELMSVLTRGERATLERALTKLIDAADAFPRNGHRDG